MINRVGVLFGSANERGFVSGLVVELFGSVGTARCVGMCVRVNV